MAPLAAVFLSSLLISLILTPIVGVLVGRRLGVMDIPGPLSIHSRPTPRVGGIAIFAGLCAGLGLSGFLGLPIEPAHRGTLLIVVSCGALVGAVGLLADMGKIPSGAEVAFLLLGATLPAVLGLRLTFAPLESAAIPITVFYLLGGASAMNLLDGMDGLAGGVAVIAAAFFLLLAETRGDQTVAILAGALGGSVAGFLFHNFHPARIFMGDVGSLSLGFVLASMAVLSTPTAFDLEDFSGPILILGVPVLDTALAIGRRLAQGRGILCGDRGHLYDLLLARGFSVRVTALLMYALALLFGLSAFLTSVVRTSHALIATGVLACALLVLAHRLGALRHQVDGRELKRRGA